MARLFAFVTVLHIIVLSTCNALQKDDAFIVALKADNSISEDYPMQNDEPSTGLEGASAEIYSLKIHSDIRYRYCRTQVISRVVNRNANNSNEVVFQMVLPETAFISKFLLEIDGKTYEAYVKEKEEAKQIYSDARSRGQSTALVEVNARHANVFNVNVNVEAKSKVNFNLTYEELLIRKFNRYEHVININPEKFARIPDFGVTVNLHESQNITLLKVPVLRNDTENALLGDEKINSDVSIRRPTGNTALVSWNPTVEARSRDQWTSSAHDVRKFVVQYDVARESDAGEILLMNGYFVHFFAPKDVLPLRKHVVFVLDTSGSMVGSRMAQLKQAMTYVLDDLKADDYFNIMEFASGVKVWKPNPRARIGRGHRRNRHESIFAVSTTPEPITSPRAPILATESNLRQAHRFVKSLVANGETNIHAALVEALQIISEAKPIFSAETNSYGDKLSQTVEPMIMFLTDGEPTSGVTKKDAILEKIKSLKTESPVPIYSIGFGTGVDFTFLKSLSLQNKAFARKIYEAGDADIQMRGFYKEISSPALSNINFQYTSDKYSVHKLSNKKFQNFQLGSEIAVAGYLKPKPKGSIDMVTSTEGPVNKSESILAVDIDANGRNGSISFIQRDTSKLPENSEDYFLERLWAYLTIKQLLEKESGVNDTTEYIYYDDDNGGNGDNTEDYDSYEDEFTTTVSPFTKPVETPKERALRIALKYGFVTPITSLVVVKPNETSSSVDLLEPLALPTNSNRNPSSTFQQTLHLNSSGSSSSRSRTGSSDGASLSRSSTSSSTRSSGGIMPALTQPPTPPLGSYRSQGNPGFEGYDANASIPLWYYPQLAKPGPYRMSQHYGDDDEEDLPSLRGFSTIQRELKRIQWLKSPNGDLLEFISVNQTQYVVETNPQVMLHSSSSRCVIQSQRKVGTCKLLKDCIKSAFWNDRLIYLKDYFCPLLHAGKKYAGSCCAL